MNERKIPLKDPQATPTYKSADGLTLNAKKGGLILVADPSVDGVWSFSNRKVAERVHAVLDGWLYPEPK